MELKSSKTKNVTFALDDTAKRIMRGCATFQQQELLRYPQKLNVKSPTLLLGVSKEEGHHREGRRSRSRTATQWSS